MPTPDPEPKPDTQARGTEILATNTPEQARQKLARMALDEMDGLVAVLDAQGNVLDVHGAALEGAGSTLAEVAGKPLWECSWWAVSEETRQALRHAVTRAASGERVRYDVEIYGRPAGKDTPRDTTDLDFSLRPVKDETGEVMFIIAEGRDISERKARERELSRQNADLEELLECVLEGDEEWKAALLEDGTRDSLTRPFSDKQVLVRVRNLIRIRQSQIRERQDAAVNEALHRVAASFASELDQQKLLQLVTDEATALTGAQFGSFFFNVTREDGGVYLLYTLSGAPPEAFARFPMPRATPLFGPTFRGEGVIRLDDVRQDPRYGNMGKQPEGHLPVVSYLAVPVVGKGGEVLGGLFFGHGEPARFTEVHERIARGLAAHAAAALEKARLYEALRLSEARAREADRRKDEFLAMLGHELRNPLAPIMTALELMTLRGGTSSTRKEQQVIERQVRHLARLVDDLLDIARVTRGKIQINKQRLDLASVIERAVEVASPLLEERAHNLRLAAPRGLVIDADPERLAQVISNLLTNAAKYTDPGGSIVLGAEAREDRVVISVKDNGQGIAAELLPHIFDLFVQGQRTLERAQGGLGIGLGLVRNLVELHGGRVYARSDGPGQGSEFVIELPAAMDAPRPAPAPDIVLASRRPRLESRILLVDDNVDAASALGDALTLLGYQVVVAHDGPQALAAAESFRPDTALLDIGLPVMDGYELARLLRERWADRPGQAGPPGRPVRFVAITGYGQESDKKRARAAGFDAHLVKPIDLAELVALLQPRDTGAT
jgi:PAS domain S-box-containing protein